MSSSSASSSSAATELVVIGVASTETASVGPDRSVARGLALVDVLGGDGAADGGDAVGEVEEAGHAVVGFAALLDGA